MAKTLQDMYERNNTVALVALIISVLAILLALGAFSQARTMTSQVDEVVTSLTNDAQRQLARVDLQNRLQRLGQMVENEEAIADVDQEMTQLRSAAQQTFNTTTSEGQEQLRLFNDQLDVLEDQLRENSAEAVATVASLLEQLETEIRSNPE